MPALALTDFTCDVLGGDRLTYLDGMKAGIKPDSSHEMYVNHGFRSMNPQEERNARYRPGGAGQKNANRYRKSCQAPSPPLQPPRACGGRGIFRGALQSTKQLRCAQYSEGLIVGQPPGLGGEIPPGEFCKGRRMWPAMWPTLYQTLGDDFYLENPGPWLPGRPNSSTA